MSLPAIVTWIVYLAHVVVAPLLLFGFIRTGKARLQGRQGPTIWQPFWDIAKLVRKRFR